ncbi:MAG TPA: S-methyl-5-thioribose-1-phosphate isomerase, partial [Candidatus Eremiobacteraeota bacterium]|nr:S-methyl-5-thioribose-1-phosphate isomerase [Candidatus Eremiobacteraeota bacterium]
MVKTIEYIDGKIRLIDQTKLPLVKEWIICEDYLQIAESIKKMHIRGAPAIGVAAAYGMALAAQNFRTQNINDFLKEIEKASMVLRESRPTAVNLFWAVERMVKLANESEIDCIEEIRKTMLEEAKKIEEEDANICRKIGEIGSEIIPAKATILTHCNAGALATADYGTALGVIRSAHKQGKDIHVFVDETRPYLQGARLTAWELMEEGINISLITDNMAGHFMSRGMIDIILVGADRISSNGDVANKIGTYSVAVLAKENQIPFYSVAPISTFDITLKAGYEIPIEERNPEEVTHIFGIQIAPTGV